MDRHWEATINGCGGADGTYQNCIKLKEVLADGDVEYKYFVKGIGVVREVPADGDVLLISHTATPAKSVK